MTKKYDIVSLLKRDHRAVEALFGKLDKTTESAGKTRDKLFRELRNELSRHTHGEEVVLYPALKDHEKVKDIAFESVEEHGVVKYLLAKLSSTNSATEEWTGMITVLKEAVQHHVKEEEQDMFPKMKKIFVRGQLISMGVEFEEAKKTMVEKFREIVAA